MGWKADWLYRLIFKEFERAWSKAQNEGVGPHGPAPDQFLVSLFSDVDFERVSICHGTPVQSWSYTGDDWEEMTSYDASTPDDKVQGMYFQRATGRFHISNDRTTVVIEYWLGPRYGRGFVFHVRGQGRTGQLLPKPDSRSWFS